MIPSVAFRSRAQSAWANQVADELNAATADLAELVEDLGDGTTKPWGVAWGVEGRRRVGTASSWTNGTATPTDVTVTSGQAPSITAALSTSRLYRAVCRAPITSSVGTDVLVWQFVENGTPTELSAVLVTGSPTARFESVFVPASSASVIYKMQGRRSSSSTGTLNLSGVGASHPLVFYIEDIGPA